MQENICSQNLQIKLGTQEWLICLFDLWFYVPVNNYGHVEMVS